MLTPCGTQPIARRSIRRGRVLAKKIDTQYVFGAEDRNIRTVIRNTVARYMAVASEEGEFQMHGETLEIRCLHHLCHHQQRTIPPLY